MTADTAMDPIIDRHRKAQTEEEVQQLSWQLAEMVQSQACRDSRVGITMVSLRPLRWIRWPADGNVMKSQLPLQSYVFWIDENVREETLKARKAGRSFGKSHAFMTSTAASSPLLAVEISLRPSIPTAGSSPPWTG
jgi:microcin C transport system substrate-binding protein